MSGNLHAQRVQIPTTTVPPESATFAAPPLGASTAPVYGAAPSTTYIGPPPPIDAYGGGIAAPSTVTPYTYSAPPPAAPQAYSAAPTTQGSLYPEGLPFGWESGTYSYEQGNVRFTKFMQSLDGEYTHLFGDSASDLRLNRVEITSTFAWPLLGNIDTPVLLTPGFVFNFFKDYAPGGLGTHEEYEAFLDTAWFPQVNEHFGAELGFRTGVWSDFEEVNDNSVRFLGRGLAIMRLSPTTEVLAGVVYLDRERVKILPAGGLRCRPTPDLEIHAVFPSPKARHRLQTTSTTDWWVFLAGEYGGGSWTSRENPIGFDYNDIRVSLGFEFETQSQVSGSFEVGYVFEREYYQPGNAGGPSPVAPEFNDTVMLRFGVNL